LNEKDEFWTGLINDVHDPLHIVSDPNPFSNFAPKDNPFTSPTSEEGKEPVYYSPFMEEGPPCESVRGRTGEETNRDLIDEIKSVIEENYSPCTSPKSPKKLHSPISTSASTPKSGQALAKLKLKEVLASPHQTLAH